MTYVATRNSDQFRGQIAPTYGKCYTCGYRLEYAMVYLTPRVQAPYMYCRNCNTVIYSEVAGATYALRSIRANSPRYEESVSEAIKEEGRH